MKETSTIQKAAAFVTLSALIVLLTFSNLFAIPECIDLQKFKCSSKYTSTLCLNTFCSGDPPVCPAGTVSQEVAPSSYRRCISADSGQKECDYTLSPINCAKEFACTGCIPNGFGFYICDTGGMVGWTWPEANQGMKGSTCP